MFEKIAYRKIYAVKSLQDWARDVEGERMEGIQTADHPIYLPTNSHHTNTLGSIFHGLRDVKMYPYYKPDLVEEIYINFSKTFQV